MTPFDLALLIFLVALAAAGKLLGERLALR